MGSGLMGPGESIEVWLRARDAARFQADMTKSAASVEEVGAAGKKAATGLASMKTMSLTAGGYLSKLGGTLNSVGKKMTGIGATMRRHITLPILAIGAASVIAAVHFDREMTQIQTQAGASAKEVRGFRSAVLGMSGRDVMQGPDDLAKGLYHLRSVGLKGGAALKALKISADEAAVGNANLEETSTALGAAWLVHIKGAGSLHHTMATLNATVGAGNMRFGELITALGTGLLPAAKVAGLGLKDTMSAMAIFTDEGYTASSAAAQFSTALHFLYNPGQKASDALASIHLKSDQLAKDMHKPKGLLVAMKDLKTHLDSIGAGGKGARFKEVMNPLTGKKTLAKDAAGDLIPLNKQAVKEEQTLGAILPGGRGRIMLTLLNQLDRYGMKYGQISNLVKKYDADVARTKQTPAYRLHAAMSTVQKTGVELGATLIPIVVPALQKLAHWIEGVGHWFEKLSPTQKKIVLGFLAFAAAAGPVLSVIGFMTIGIGGLATALGFLAANPIVLIIAAVVALGVGLFVAYEKVKWFHNAVNAVFSFLWKHWPLLVPILMALTGPIGVVALVVFKLRHTFVSVFGSIKHAVGDAIGWMADRFRDFIKFLGRVKDKIMSIPGAKQALGVGKFLVQHSPAGEAVHFGKKLLGLAEGGVVNSSGVAVVGERGPELRWLNAGDVVSPFASADPLRGGTISMPSSMKGGTVAPMDPEIHVHIHDNRPVVVQVKGREIGRAVAQDTADQLARR